MGPPLELELDSGPLLYRLVREPLEEPLELVGGKGGRGRGVGVHELAACFASNSPR